MALTKEQRAQYDGLFPLDGTEYFEAPAPLVDGVIPKSEYTLLTGQPKVGKSTFAAHLAYSVATGEPFFGREVRDPGLVLYIAMERAYQTETRINKLFELGERKQENIILFTPQESSMKCLFFNEKESVEKLTQRLDQSFMKDVKLVIVDSLENTLVGSDSESRDAGPWCNGLQEVLAHFETTGLVLHHETKTSEGHDNSNSAYRGSSVFLARSGQWLRAVDKTKGIVQLKAQRGNFGSEWKESVCFNDFGLFSESMPILSKDKRPSFVDFCKARLIENPMITSKALAVIIEQHPESEWTSVSPDKMSRTLSLFGDSIIKHVNPADGREKLLEMAA